jgi:hypothetical protein
MAAGSGILAPTGQRNVAQTSELVSQGKLQEIIWFFVAANAFFHFYGYTS